MPRALAAGLGVPAARDDVDVDRTATCGFSMCGTHAYWRTKLDPRVRAAAQLCCFASLREPIGTGAHDLHGACMTVPGLLRRGDMGDVAGLATPRPQFVGIGRQDELTPPRAFDTTCQTLADAADRRVSVVEPASGGRGDASCRTFACRPAGRGVRLARISH